MSLAAEYTRTSRLLEEYRSEIRSEMPLRLHAGTDSGGTPDFSPEFMRWLTRAGKRRHDDLLPVTKALRELRKQSYEEYEVVIRRMMGWSCERIADWKGDGWDERAIAVMLIAGVSKMETWINTIWA